jgi:hypothetical protein
VLIFSTSGCPLGLDATLVQAWEESEKRIKPTIKTGGDGAAGSWWHSQSWNRLAL